jgi:hypothetical protein
LKGLSGVTGNCHAPFLGGGSNRKVAPLPCTID